MTFTSRKRGLPLLPHPDHLRKQAKARIATLREKMPTTRLSDAQSVIAREYGFANWGELQAEVTRRNRRRGQRASLRRADLAPFHSRRFPGDELSDQDSDIHTPQDFFRMGVIAQVGFIFVALSGLALVFVAVGPPHGVIATTMQIGQPLARLVHRIF